MAKVTTSSVQPVLSVTLELTEVEARALDGIFGYSADAFLKVFYAHMGTAYVQPHEAGVRSLHQTLRGSLSAPIAAIDAARKILSETNQK